MNERNTGSSPTVTTTNPVGVQDQRLPDFFAYPSRVRTFRSQEYALFCQRGTQKGYADHLKTAYPCRRLVHIHGLVFSALREYIVHPVDSSINLLSVHVYARPVRECIGNNSDQSDIVLLHPWSKCRNDPDLLSDISLAEHYSPAPLNDYCKAFAEDSLFCRHRASSRHVHRK